jgi:hypothetical protein
MRYYFILGFFAALFLTACKKYDFDNSITGESISDFSLVAPAANANIGLNAATPDDTVVFSWTAATPGVKEAVRYKFIAVPKGSTNFDAENRIIELQSDNEGSTTKLTVTHQQLDDALKAKNISAGQAVELLWSVEATNGATTEISTASNNVTITRMLDGATPFLLFSPANSLTPVAIDPNATGSMLNFRWTRSLPASGGPEIKYSLLFAERQTDAEGNELPIDWTDPLFTIASGNSGSDTLANVSYKQISDSLAANGFADPSLPANLKWTVVATSGTWNQFATYANDLVIVREVKMYLVGSATPGGWDIAQSVRMISDPKNAGTFYIYVYLNAGELKFVNGQQWPPASGAIDWGQKKGGAAGELTDTDEDNISVSTSGIYRVTVDTKNSMYYVQKQHGRMGIVGGGTTAGWNPSAVFPAQEMGFLGTNLFLGITDVAADGEFKMLDNSDWPNGNIDYTRDYEDGGEGKLAEEGGPNFKWTGATGPVRVIWDYRDVTAPKYIVNSAAEMRVVGNGMKDVAEWTPAASPQMTYAGNGKWTITLNLIGGKEIKFLAGNDWGAFDYEDAGDGKIKWEGGDNFKTPDASGQYTITLDEYKGTITIQ